MNEHITADPEGSDWWVCICKNTPGSDGFYPIDETVNEVEPTEDAWKTDCYACIDCGRIVNMHTLEVVRRIDPQAFVWLHEQPKPKPVLEGEHTVALISPHLGVVVDASNCIMLRTFLGDGAKDRDITLSDVRALTTALANAQSFVRMRENAILPSIGLDAL